MAVTELSFLLCGYPTKEACPSVQHWAKSLTHETILAPFQKASIFSSSFFFFFYNILLICRQKPQRVELLEFSCSCFFPQHFIKQCIQWHYSFLSSLPDTVCPCPLVSFGRESCSCSLWCHFFMTTFTIITRGLHVMFWKLFCSLCSEKYLPAMRSHTSCVSALQTMASAVR